LRESRGDLAKYIVVFVVLLAGSLGSIHILRATLRTQYPLMVVVSQSMVPTLGVGDFILVGRIDSFGEVTAASQPEGDILVFASHSASDEYIVHRAVEKFQGNGGWRFVTKGDNNPVSDGHPVPESRVVGRVVGRVPLLGYFPLFIKTSRGLLLVASLMAIVFFADYIMPIRREDTPAGRFPWVSLLPFVAAPVADVAFFFIPKFHLEIDLLALVCWYIGCFIAPLAFRDDDLCLMFWLYSFVILIIPLGLDLVWWLTGITPSNWWSVHGSTVPVTWLLMKETPMYHEVFSVLLLLLLPSCALFLLTMTAKRRGVSPLVAVSRWMRASRPARSV